MFSEPTFHFGVVFSLVLLILDSQLDTVARQPHLTVRLVLQIQVKNFIIVLSLSEMWCYRLNHEDIYISW